MNNVEGVSLWLHLLVLVGNRDGFPTWDQFMTNKLGRENGQGITCFSEGLLWGTHKSIVASPLLSPLHAKADGPVFP